jgi:hypothetical protein
MKMIKLITHIDNTGMLRLELPTQLTNRTVEVVIVLHPTPTETSIGIGWPERFFETLDAIEADDLVERPDQGAYEEREILE